MPRCGPVKSEEVFWSGDVKQEMSDEAKVALIRHTRLMYLCCVYRLCSISGLFVVLLCLCWQKWISVYFSVKQKHKHFLQADPHLW